MYDINEIIDAAKRLKNHIYETPLFENYELNSLCAGTVYLKPECMQMTGSFKIRGAFNFMSQLSQADAKNGVVAFSSGNHAQGVAMSGKILNIDTTIVIPEDAPHSKIENTEKLGGNVILYDRYNEDREKIARDIASERNAILVPSYDHKNIIIGQGTVGLEIIEEINEKSVTLDQVLICCGGGGLSAGSSIPIKKFSPETEIYLVEPEHYNDTQRSIDLNKRVSNNSNKTSICDALLADTPGELTFAINSELTENVLTVSDEEVKAAMRFAFHYFKMIVEPGGAVALAAVMSKKIELRNKVTVAVLSGGNVDMEMYDEIQSEKTSEH